MAQVWLLSTGADGEATLASSLERCGHTVARLDAPGALPDVVVVGPAGGQPAGTDNGNIETSAIPVVRVGRPFSPAAVAEAVEEQAGGSSTLIDLSAEPARDQAELMRRLDELVADVRILARATANGSSAHFEGVLHHLSRANVTMFEALSDS